MLRRLGRDHARPSARTRRLQAAVAREERLRKRGVDTGQWREELAAARDASMRADAVRAAEPAAGAVPIRRVLASGLLLLLGGIVVGAVLLWFRIDAFNRAVSSAPTLSSALLGPLGGSERVNVAFLGYAGEEGHGGTYLADSINILSIDPTINTTTLIAVPRDTWVEGHALFPENGKINEAFAVGWAMGGVHEAGRAAADVLEYHRAHPNFPHEPTSDQFFDEAQWESYRKLGEHIARRLFRRPGAGADPAAKSWWPDELV